MESKSIQDSSKVRNRKTLQHKDDYFITYMNGNFYSKQWMEDVNHGNDWYDPHWREEIPRTKWNIFWYRYLGKLPWLPWNKFFTSAIVTPSKYTIICGLILLLSVIIFTGCMQRTTCWKIVNGGKCIPIQTYEEWNKCVANCEVTLGTKAKPYEKRQWIRPRPYAYP